jgi:hypothetical protein
MQEKLENIIEEIQYNKPEVANAIISKYELNEGEINVLLDWATRWRHYDLMHACIAKKIDGITDVDQKIAGFIDIRSDGIALLHMVVGAGRTEVVRAILESPHCSKDWLNDKDGYGRTSLQRSAYNRRT